MNQLCQMTLGEYGNYYKCGRKAKFKLPKKDMAIEFVCGIHAKVLNRKYELWGEERCSEIVKEISHD